MSARTDIPLSCRTCSFYRKCFGPQAKAGVLPPDVRPGLLGSRHIEAGGIRTRVLEAGSHGEPVVFLHGEGGRAERWSYNLQAIAGLGYRVFAPDLPGHGQAGKDPAFDHSVAGYAGFISRLLDELNISSATLVGVSLGGAIAAKVAVEAPHRISKLVLAASPGIVTVGPEMGERLKRLVTFRTREGAIERLRRTFLSPMLVTEDLVDAEFAASGMPGARECLGKLGAYLTEGLDADVLGERLAAFAASHSTLILWGSEDRILPASVGAETARVANGAAQLVVVEECGHALPMEAPGVFNRLLGDFLQAREAGLATAP